MGMSMKHRTQRVENEAFFSGRIARKPIFNSRSLVNSLALHRLLAFGTGLSFGCLLAGVIALAFLFATPQAASEPNAVKSRGVTINTPEAKSAAPSAATADSEDFIDGNFWALIIGINKYPTMDADKQLEAARKDAEAISKLLVDRYGFSKERMTELYDEAARELFGPSHRLSAGSPKKIVCLSIMPGTASTKAARTKRIKTNQKGWGTGFRPTPNWTIRRRTSLIPRSRIILPTSRPVIFMPSSIRVSVDLLWDAPAVSV